MPTKPGKYIHFKGTKYEVIGTVTHSETMEEMVLYRALYGDGNLWVRPESMWNEVVEYEGRQTKRFIHEDEAMRDLPEPLAGIHKDSLPDEKIALFQSVFFGRDDVFAKRWENNKKGTAGYAPACHHEWSSICPKAARGKIKCADCQNQNFIQYDEDAIEKHLKGTWTIGIYPMLPDETCRFLVFDFDGKDYAPDQLQRDVASIREACAEKQIYVATERSRSGKGIHLWVFFSENIPATVARKLGSSLITYSMDKHHELTFQTYDRMVPGQDTMTKGGFGNLIALPLQKIPRRQENSVFVDEKFNAYSDQWQYIYSIKKYTWAEIDGFIRELSQEGELGTLRENSEEETPWESGKPVQRITRDDLPKTVNIVQSNMLYIKKDGISSRALNTLKRLAAFRNPEFYKAQAMRLSTYDKPRIISCSDETDQYLCLPRGLKEEVVQILRDNGVDIDLVDKVCDGRGLDVTFKGTLYDEQQQAAAALLAHDNGILSAKTAFGKTVIGAYMIAERKVNTLILVHRTNLLSQWQRQLNEFLIINEEPIVEFTPKGRKRKKALVGQIGGGKNNLSGVVDIAVMQSLVSGDEVKDLVKDYGMVIVDECHHVSAFSFEQILKNVTSRFVYGLTATPTRKDGHHPIIYMHCGKIRYRVDAKSQADARPFEHYIIPRFTRFRKPPYQDEAKWMITDIYRDIQNSEIRNELIVRDVAAAVEQGRSPIILTERTEHVKILTCKLQTRMQNVISMTGGMGQKKSRELFQSIANIPKDEPFALVATGKYVGEGFDMPRLDTLFLAMPISWTGTVQQYAGRLHRLFDGKTEVQIYDYVDIHVAMLEKMYQKRLRSYAFIGYKAKGTSQPAEAVHSIFDNNNFFPIYSSDILAARNEILVVSPFLAKRRTLSTLNYFAAANATVRVITKPPDNYAEKDRAKIKDCIELLVQNGVSVTTMERIHQKFAIIDQRIVWYGSINLLSYGSSEESIMRIDSPDIAAELIETLNSD
jgi:superfamily II DNA or RNA helicase